MKLVTTRARRSGAARAATAAADHEAAAAVLLDAVRAVVRELRGTLRATEQQLGVQGAELFVLRKLAERPADSLAELAERTQTDSSTASTVVSRLVDRGLAARTVASADRRRTPIAITAAGRHLLRRAPAPAHQQVAAATSDWSAGELTALAGTLRELAERLAQNDAGG